MKTAQNARSFASHALIVMLEQSEASYERILRSRMTSVLGGFGVADDQWSPLR